MTSNESVYARIHRVLTWKRVVAFNVFLLLVLVIPLSVRLAQEDTENRSSAAEFELPSPTPLPSYPALPPRLERVTLFYGKPGDAVVLLGKNFGDYQWESEVYVGGAKVEQGQVVRWSDGIVEVQIPEGARTGNVWIVVNGKRADWNGSLFLYDFATSLRVGFTKIAEGLAQLYVENGAGIVRGMVEVEYTFGAVSAGGLEGVNLSNQSTLSDSYGLLQRVEFGVDRLISPSRTPLLNFSFSGGEMSIARVEFYDGSGRLVPAYSDPLAVRVTY